MRNGNNIKIIVATSESDCIVMWQAEFVSMKKRIM